MQITVSYEGVILFLLLIITVPSYQEVEVGNEANNVYTKDQNVTSSTRFLIFDVNPGEGFNLRRDVYIRVANLVRYMIDRGEEWVLVLPPWSHLYHWKSRYLNQEATQWKSFFDIDNLNSYVPVMEFKNFIRLQGYAIDHLLYLQMHPDGFSGGWNDIVEFAECKDKLYHKDDNGFFRGYFWHIDKVYAKKYNCVDVQGHSTVLADFLKKLDAKSVFIPRCEQVQHVSFGGVESFKARRSLVFAKRLREEADMFRQKFLNSTDENDKTPYNPNWRQQIPKESKALGGPYIGVHMRRGDFTYAHQQTVPSITEISKETNKILKKYNLTVVYVATDGEDEEVEELRSLVKAKIYRFPRTREIIRNFKDGGVAIIDQWIVAHARYFIGTCVSTFSFRIHEERDILGFDPDTTFNCICGAQSPPDKCEQPTRWRVKFS